MDWSFVGRTEPLDRITAALEGEPGSVFLQGDLGIGKTSLARTVARALRERGWHIELILASPAARPIPFGAFSHLLPENLSSDPAIQIERIRRDIVARADNARLLVVVDDVNYLDHGSMALVHRLAAGSDASVLATCRTGELGHDETLTALWKDGHAERVIVPPLDRRDHDQLVTEALGRVRATGMLDRMWQLTQGNPLFLREILSQPAAELEASLDFSLTAPARVTSAERLSAIIGARMRELPELSGAALEIVAMAEPISIDLLLAFTSSDVLADLQQRSIVVVEHLGEGQHVRGAHPVYGATIRGMLPASRRAEIAARLADALIDRAPARQSNVLQAALWLEVAGRPLPADIATRAATEALLRCDAPLAERLASTTTQSEGTVARLVALGTALSLQHKPGARDVLHRAIQLAATEEERVQATLACHRHLAFHGDDPAEGATLLRDLIPNVWEAAAKSELEAELAFYARAGGDAVNAVRLAEGVLEEPGAHDRAVVSALVQSTRARITLGRFEGLEADLDRGEELAGSLRDERPLAFEYLRCNRAIYLMNVDVEAALQLSNAEYERSLQTGGPSGVWALTQAHAYLSRGNLDVAFGHARRSVAELAQFDPFFNLPSAHAVAALVSAQRGQFHEAQKWLDSLDGPRVRGWVWAERARLWMGTERDSAAAHARAFSAANEAESLHIIAWGAAQLFHDIVRLGDPSVAVAPLERIAAGTTSPLIAAMARHAKAAASRDGEELALVAEEFAERGMLLLAAEALAQAANCDGTAAPLRDRRLARAAHVLASCPGAATPLVSGIESPLSDREAEIASLAAGGATSRQIAERLVLSARTVDNHLAAVYRRLGLSGRDELAAIFGCAGSK